MRHAIKTNPHLEFWIARRRCIAQLLIAVTVLPILSVCRQLDPLHIWLSCSLAAKSAAGRRVQCAVLRKMLLQAVTSFVKPPHGTARQLDAAGHAMLTQQTKVGSSSQR